MLLIIFFLCRPPFLRWAKKNVGNPERKVHKISGNIIRPRQEMKSLFVKAREMSKRLVCARERGGGGGHGWGARSDWAG